MLLPAALPLAAIRAACCITAAKFQLVRVAEPSTPRPADYPEYSLLAARIAVSNLHKMTKKSFGAVMTDLRSYVNPKTNKESPLISEWCKLACSCRPSSCAVAHRTSSASAGGDCWRTDTVQRTEEGALLRQWKSCTKTVEEQNTRHKTHTHTKGCARAWLTARRCALSSGQCTAFHMAPSFCSRASSHCSHVDVPPRSTGYKFMQDNAEALDAAIVYDRCGTHNMDHSQHDGPNHLVL